MLNMPVYNVLQKRRGKGSKAKGDAKDLNAIKGATKLNKGDEPRR